MLWHRFSSCLSWSVVSCAVHSWLSGDARRGGLVYGWNTLGAAAGAFVTTWVLFSRLGLEGSLYLAAGLNAAAAIVVVPIALAAARSAAPSAAMLPKEDEAADDSTTHIAERWSVGAWIALYGIAGFQALSLEIIWFRVLGVAMKSSAFTFGTLLTIYLTGLGVGAAVRSLLL